MSGILSSVVDDEDRFIFGSNHARSAANIFSLIASCRLHDLDAEAYLADVIVYCRAGPEIDTRARAEVLACDPALRTSAGSEFFTTRISGIGALFRRARNTKR